MRRFAAHIGLSLSKLSRLALRRCASHIQPFEERIRTGNRRYAPLRVRIRSSTSNR